MVLHTYRRGPLLILLSHFFMQPIHKLIRGVIDKCFWASVDIGATRSSGCEIMLLCTLVCTPLLFSQVITAEYYLEMTNWKWLLRDIKLYFSINLHCFQCSKYRFQYNQVHTLIMLGQCKCWLAFCGERGESFSGDVTKPSSFTASLDV